MDLRDSGRASLRASRVVMPARTEPRPPKYAFPDSQDHARSFSRLIGRVATAGGTYHAPEVDDKANTLVLRDREVYPGGP